jgi:hypothetical protein
MSEARINRDGDMSMRTEFGIALIAGVGLGLLAMLVLYAASAVAWAFDPPPPDALFWLRPTMTGSLVGAILSGIGCGFGAATVLRRLSGETGPLRLKTLALLTLAWTVTPLLALFLSGATLNAMSLGPLTLPAAALLCGLAMVASAEIYFTL